RPRGVGVRRRRPPVPPLPPRRRGRRRRGGDAGGGGAGRAGRRDATRRRRRPPRRPARAGRRGPGPAGAVVRRADRTGLRTPRLARRGAGSATLCPGVGVPLPHLVPRRFRRRPAHVRGWRRSRGGDVNQFCPRCGALFAPDVNMEFSTTQVLCVECGLALEEPPRVLPPSDVDDEQVAYDLAEWPAEDRTIATADLVELEIPYRWEEGLVLV